MTEIERLFEELRELMPEEPPCVCWSCKHDDWLTQLALDAVMQVQMGKARWN
jgi:hypothetical protein